MLRIQNYLKKKKHLNMSTPHKKRIISMQESINEALIMAAKKNKNIVFFAQGIEDPTAVFGTLKGLSKTIEKKRIIETPVAENATCGIAIGAAMTGLIPVISFHRTEFALLAIEQIFNNAAKSHYISRGTHSVPMLLRLIIGRGWGQGPAHSQSLESLFSAIPGLKVIMPSFPDDAKGLIISALEDRNPFICIENRWSHYTKGNVKKGYYKSDITKPKRISKGKDITIVSTGFMTLEVKRAVDLLKEINVAVDHFDLRVLRPLFLDEIVQSVKQTGFIMCVDTGHRTLGIGSEIISFVTEKAFKYMKTPPVRLGLPDHPTPSSRGLVIDFYPDTLKILKEVFGSLKLEKSFLKSFELKIREERNNLPIDVPDNFFKGPF